MKLSLGKYVDGGSCEVDLAALIVTRMLVQASSGSGKSWLLRRLLEVTSGHVHQLIIDPEGEFASLREKHDLVICAAAGGDALAHPKTAALLARRLMETEASAVLDISELKSHERHSFVRIFIQALMELDKALRHPTLVVLDEAQLFAPEKGESEALGAVIDIATRGRKRGLCLVPATQRISMFHKSVAAECKNRLIGGTSLDLDVKRAAFDLGMPPAEALKVLRALKPGHFFAFGPALHQLEPREFITGDIQTTHPKVGDKRVKLSTPKPTAAILKLLPQLADLPKEAEAEAKTLSELKTELAETRRSLTVALKSQPPAIVNPKAMDAAHNRGYKAGHTDGFESARKHFSGVVDRHNDVMAQWLGKRPVLSGVTHILTPVPIPADKVLRPMPPAPTNIKQIRTDYNGDSKISKPGRAILAVLSQFPEGCDKGKLTLLAGYSWSGTFSNALGALRTAGYIEGENTGIMRITEAGMACGPFPQLPQGDDLVRYWVNNPLFSKPGRQVLEVLSDGRARTKEELCEATNYEWSGTFSNALGQLRTAGVLVGKNTEKMRISPEIVQQ